MCLITAVLPLFQCPSGHSQDFLAICPSTLYSNTFQVLLEVWVHLMLFSVLIPQREAPPMVAIAGNRE
jgi:hypothetical protein